MLGVDEDSKEVRGCLDGSGEVGREESLLSGSFLEPCQPPFLLLDGPIFNKSTQQAVFDLGKTLKALYICTVQLYEDFTLLHLSNISPIVAGNSSTVTAHL